MFQNPMMLMMVGVGAMALLMPYLLVSFSQHFSMLVAHAVVTCQKNMDSESLKDLKDQQARAASFQNTVASGDFKKFASSQSCLRRCSNF
jgi:hypothetical protein